MKFRPQIQLRFRDEEQYREVKGAASKENLSVNEWVLRKIENGSNVLTGFNSQSRARKSHKAVPETVESDGSSLAGNQSGQQIAHDTANCRVRGCGMCKVLGVKDAGRGLK